MAKQKEKIEIGYRIIKIHTSKFSFEDLDEKSVEKLFNSTNLLAVNMTTMLNIDKEKSTITIDIGTALTEKGNNRTLIEHSGRTIYHVQGLKNVYNKGKDYFDIPDGFLIQLYSLAYSHSRALLATEISPTIFKDKYFLPVINPIDLIKQKSKPTHNNG
ncbi:MAG: hypothetical protein PHW92_03805 [Lutibacter sp.]|nr:hypothetical protein [Lutibacter sp.]